MYTNNERIMRYAVPNANTGETNFHICLQLFVKTFNLYSVIKLMGAMVRA